VAIIEQGRLLAVGSVEEIQQGRSRQRAVHVRVLGGADALGNWLTARGDIHNLDLDHETARFVHDGDEASEADLLREIVLAGFRVAYFGSQAKSLEDVFMQVTEGLVQ
jgi:ABC-2 type transport system ATP-binding protein